MSQEAPELFGGRLPVRGFSRGFSHGGGFDGLRIGRQGSDPFSGPGYLGLWIRLGVSPPRPQPGRRVLERIGDLSTHRISQGEEQELCQRCASSFWARFGTACRSRLAYRGFGSRSACLCESDGQWPAPLLGSAAYNVCNDWHAWAELDQPFWLGSNLGPPHSLRAEPG